MVSEPPSEATAVRPRIDFTVYANEPLVRVLARASKSRPTVLVLGFYAFVTIPLFGMHALAGRPESARTDYISFVDNISWSLSVVFLLPFVVGLSLRYYEEIPRLFRELIGRFAESGVCDVSAFESWLRRRFNDPISPLLIAGVTLYLNWWYLGQVLEDPQVSWMNGGTLLRDALGTKHGLTWFGAYAMVVQVILIYWVANLVNKGAVMAWGLREFFDNWCNIAKVDPLHPDGVCGFAAIGRVTGILNRVFFLLGLYLSLKVIDKLVVQDSSLLEDIGNPMMLGGYAILAPLLFFLPLAAAHDKMFEAKERFLRPICELSAAAIRNLGGAASDEDAGAARVEVIIHLEQLKDEMRRKIPVWPFNFKSVQSFFAMVAVPLLPVILSIGADLLMD